MKKMILFFLSLLVMTTGFAEHFVLDNKANIKKSKFAIQWANSAQEVQKQNNGIKQELKWSSEILQVLTQTGTINVEIPKKAVYFRILAWLNGAKEPNFLTNWIDIAPNKMYTLKKEHLIPVILVSGVGC